MATKLRNSQIEYDIVSNIPSATTTEVGVVELATDAEATAWTDETRYINSKQAKDNYELVFPWTTITYYSDAGWATSSASYVTLASYTATRNWIYRVQYSCSHSNNFVWETRVLADWLILWERDPNTLNNEGMLYAFLASSENNTLYWQVALSIWQTIQFQANCSDVTASTTLNAVSVKWDR